MSPAPAWERRSEATIPLHLDLMMLLGWGRTMSGWQELEAERNQRSVLRLNKALPPIFPRAVLGRALARPFVPPTPRLAIESYWGRPSSSCRSSGASTSGSQPSARWLGLGGLGTAGAACLSRSAPHPRRTVKPNTLWARDFAACALLQRDTPSSRNARQKRETGALPAPRPGAFLAMTPKQAMLRRAGQHRRPFGTR